MVNYPLLYLEHLSDQDLAVLDECVEVGSRSAQAKLREHPERIDELLAAPELYRHVFVDQREVLEARCTPFLAFAALVHQAARELGEKEFVQEWSGPRRRLPVFDVVPLRRFLESGLHRYFLTELLTSFTRVASGSLWVRTRRGVKRRRFSELDPLQLVEMIEGTPQPVRPALYRRLGDVALFLTGVFPDHTARRRLTMSQLERLARSASIEPPELLRLAATPSPIGEGGTLTLLEATGERWYRMAVDAAPAGGGSASKFLSDIAGWFREARRVLNYLTDRYLYRFEAGWLPGPPA